MTTIDVSIIIVNWNTRDILRDCLRSVFAGCDGIESEIIVIDNASSDGSAKMVQEEFGQVQLIANGVNRGFAAANNQGMLKARGRYVLLLNSDTIVLGHAIERAVAFADSDPRAGVVGCRVLNADRTLQPTCFMFPSVANMLLSCTYLYKVFPRSKVFGRERMTWWNRDDVREVDVVTGCFMLVRREAIDEVGLLGEQFFMYGEETDWCFRFKQAGWKVLFAPVGEIIHLGGQSAEMLPGPMMLQLRGSILLFIKKQQSFLNYLLACGLTSVFFAFRVPVWTLRSMWDRRARSRCSTYLKGAVLALTGSRRLCVRQKV